MKKSQTNYNFLVFNDVLDFNSEAFQLRWCLSCSIWNSKDLVCVYEGAVINDCAENQNIILYKIVYIWVISKFPLLFPLLLSFIINPS